MCRAIMEGGRRCPCSNPQNRRAIDRAAYAARKARGATVSREQQQLPAPVSPLQESAQQAQAIRDDLAIHRRMDTAIEERFVQAGDPDAAGRTAFRPMRDIERDVTQLGSQIEDRAAELAGITAEDVRSRWLERKNASRHEIDEAAAAWDQARRDRGAIVQAWKQLPADTRPDMPDLTETNKRMDDATMTQLRLRNAYAALDAGYDPIARAELTRLAHGYQAAIAELRPMGGSIESTDNSSKPAQRIVAEAAAYYPEAWIQASNARGNLRVKETKARAHYSSSRAQRVRERDYRSHQFLPAGEEPEIKAGSPLAWEKAGDPDSHGMQRWKSYIVKAQRGGTSWDYQSMTGEPPRGWTKRTEITDGGNEITVWVQPTYRLARGEIQSELTISRQPRDQAQDTPGLSVAVHEFAHRSEDCNSNIGKLEEAFLVRRTTSPTGQRDPLEHYGARGSGEKVRPDAFPERYIGKVYTSSRDRTLPTGETAPHYREVLSCGMEGLMAGSFGGLIGLGRYAPDPDMRRFILGTLATA